MNLKSDDKHIAVMEFTYYPGINDEENLTFRWEFDPDAENLEKLIQRFRTFAIGLTYTTKIVDKYLHEI